MEHTAEPWRVDADADNDGEFFWIASSSETEIAMVSDGRIGDAKRICACVNVCEGLDTGLLEKIVSLGGTLPRRLEAMTAWERSDAEKQRDELAEAIRLTLDENGHLADGDVCTLKRLKDALAKVGAGGTVIEGHNALGNRRAAFGASVLTDVLCGNGTEVGAGDTAKGTT